MMYRSTVIIPTFNRVNTLSTALAALANQSIAPTDYEVIVVSDGSTDGTSDMVRQTTFPYRIRLIEQHNQGPSVARNRGAREAESELLIYLDDDVEPVTDFLRCHLHPHLEDSALVLIGPQSAPPDENIPIWIRWEHRMLEKQYARFRTGEWAVGPNNLYSGNFSVRREHLLAAGGFCEEFTRQEDVELGFRLHKLGLRFRYDDGPRGLHRPNRTLESWFRTPYEYGRRDVQMSRDQGEQRAIQLARKHFHERNLLTRLIAYLCVGKTPLESAVNTSIINFVKSSNGRPAMAACSLLFNLRYLQGMCAELGGRTELWRILRGTEHVTSSVSRERW